MYEERKDNFSIKGFILQLIVIIIFVFLMLWLFPTKQYIKDNMGGNLQSEEQLARLEVLYGEVFANNVERMKDAAIGYYTDERLPQVVGKSEMITLQEMYEKKLVLEMTDAEGNACSVTESYVKVTKYENEYRFKVNLKCGDKEDYIIVYMGCYTYCESGMCERREETKDPEPTPTKKPTPTPSKDPEPTPEKDPDPTPQKTPKYLYEYKLVTPGKTTCTGWSEWTTKELTGSNTVQVETKTVQQKTGVTTQKYISGYTVQKVLTGTKKVQTGVTYKLVAETVTEKYISGYTTKKVITGTKDVQVGTTTKTVTKKVAAGTTNVYAGGGSGTTIPSNTSTKVYVKTGSTTKQNCTTCTATTYYTWDVYNVVTVYKIVTTTEQVPVYEKQYVYETKTVPVYSTRTYTVNKIKEVPVYKTENVYENKKVPVYSTREIDLYSDIKYYRSKTCTYTNGGTYYKWSTSKNDTALISQGYRLTGNVKEI